MIQVPHMRGFLSTPSGVWSPIDDPNVVEVYNAWDESRHSYVSARTAVSYETTGGNTTVTCGQNPTGFSTTGSGDIVIIATGDPEIDGEWTITGATGATITFANPMGNTTSGPVSVSGTVQWKHKKVSAVLGMRGLYSFTQANLGRMPQWDATAREMLSWSDRNTVLTIPSGLTSQFRALNTARSVIAFGRIDSDSGIGGMFSTTDGTGSATTYTALYQDSGNLVIAGSAGEWRPGLNVRNGNVYLYAVNGTPAPRRECFVNDMETPISESDAASWVNTGTETRPLGIFRGRVNGSMKGFCNLLIFMSGGIADQTYRENTKAWVEAPEQRGAPIP